MKSLVSHFALLLCVLISPIPCVAAEDAAFLSHSSTPQLVFDAHVDCIGRVLDRGDDLSDPSCGGQVDIPKWRAGHVNIVWVAVWVDPRRYPGDLAFHRATALIEAIRNEVKKHSRDLALCRSAQECARVAREGKIAIILGLEGGAALLDSPDLVSYFAKAGIRRITLTWRGNLSWAGSSQELNQSAVRTPRGLTETGLEILRKMNELGVVVDLSHASDLTAVQAMQFSKKPVIFSHSNARSLCNHPRNVSDALLRQLKENGGVIGVNFHSKFLRRPSIGDEITGKSAATIDDVVRHIEHIRDVAGIDHIGIGSDWDGDIVPARGLEDASKLPALFEALRAKGFTDDEIDKIAGRNFLRVLAENELP